MVPGTECDPSAARGFHADCRHLRAFVGSSVESFRERVRCDEAHVGHLQQNQTRPVHVRSLREGILAAVARPLSADRLSESSFQHLEEVVEAASGKGCRTMPTDEAKRRRLLDLPEIHSDDVPVPETAAPVPQPDDASSAAMRDDATPSLDSEVTAENPPVSQKAAGHAQKQQARRQVRHAPRKAAHDEAASSPPQVDAASEPAPAAQEHPGAAAVHSEERRPARRPHPNQHPHHQQRQAPHSNQHQHAGRVGARSRDAAAHTRSTRDAAALAAANRQRSRARHDPMRAIEDMEAAQGARSSRRGRTSVARPRRGRTPLIIILALLILAVVGGLLFFNRPIRITVDGKEYTVRASSTYNKLHDDGVITAANGDLLAVDGSVLTAGGGKPFKVYDNGKQVNNSRLVSSGANLTQEKGDDETEDATYETTTIPWTWDIEDSGRQDTYQFSLGLYVTKGTDGQGKTATGKVSGKTATVPSGQEMVPRMVRHYYINETGGRKVVALTFDDGPSEYTQQVLDILSSNGAVGTFYEVGQNIQEYPDLTKAVEAQGSEVANHSLTHTVYYGTETSEASINEIKQCNQIIKDVLGKDNTNIRPPGGYWSDTLWKPLDGQCSIVAGWTIDTRDWQRPGTESIVATATTDVKPGEVILMHDGGGDRSQTVAALDQICKTLKSQGFEFVTVSQMADIERQALVANGSIPKE